MSDPGLQTGDGSSRPGPPPATLAALAGALVVAGCAWLRTDLDRALALQGLAWLTLAAAVCAPLLLPAAVRRSRPSLLGLAPLAVALAVPPLGLWLPAWVVAIPLAALTVAGGGRVATALRWSWRGVAAGLLCAVVLALAVVVHHSASLSQPILAPELARIGELNRDAYYHAALVNGILEQGVASTATDGVRALVYPVGTHYWLAGLAGSTGTPPLLAIPLVVQVLGPPLLLYALGFAGALLGGGGLRQSGIAAVAAILGLFAYDAVGPNSLTNPGTVLFAWPPLAVAAAGRLAPLEPGGRSGAGGLGVAAVAAAAAVLLATVGTLGSGTRPLFDGFYRQMAALQVYGDIERPLRDRSFDWEVVRRGRMFPADVTKLAARSAGQRFLDEVDRLRPAGGRPAVFVPPDNTVFWGLVRSCEAKPLLVPAAAGVPMLLGMPPLAMTDCLDRMVWYDLQKTYGDAHTRALSEAELCLHARERNVDTVIVLGAAGSDAIACEG